MALQRGSSSGGYKYQRRSADAVKKRADQDGGGFDSIFKSGVDTFRPAQGTNTIRFIPPTWEDAEHYGYDVWVHQYVGADSGSYVCPKKMLDKRCPICEAQEEANAAGEEEEAKGLKAVKKVVAYIIDRDDKKPIPKLWTMSWTMDRDISTLCHSEKTGKTLLLDDPEVGYDVSFKRTGQQLNTRYLGLAIDRDDSPLLDTQKEINKLMETVQENAIPDLLLFKPEAYLEKVVNGTASKKEKDPDEDEDADTGRSRRRPRDEPEEEERPSSRRRARDPEPDEEERPARRRARDAEEEEPEPAPRRRRSEPEPEEEERPSRRRARDEEEEPEERPSRRRRSDPDEDPADDEPEERPARRRARDEEEEPEPAPSRRRRSEPEPEEEERPSRRRRAEPEDEEPAPRRRRAEPEEEEEPAPRRRRSEPEEEEEPAPRRRR